jgi:hypothetical protein
MVSDMTRRFLLLLLVAATTALSACAPDPLNAQALKEIQEMSARDAQVSNIVGVPSCGDPRSHLLTDKGYPTVFRTICRVSYKDGSIDRHKDMWCIGDFEKSPMLDHCYVWVPYE